VAGNLGARTDFMGRTTTYDYDSNGRLLSRAYPDGSAVTFTYSATGRRLTAADFRGTTSYAYDNRDRLASLTYSDGRRLEYEHDAQGNRTKLTAILTAASLVANYTFDPLNRLATVTDAVGRSYSHGYDANGNRASIAYPNGVQTAYSYDTLNRLTQLATTRPASGVTVQSYAFTLGPAGNRTGITEADGHLRSYTYDSLYRLIGERVTLDNLLQYEKAFGYDPVGNRLTQSTTGQGAGAVSYAYDARDRLLTENATSYGYDANGNLISKSAEATYTWDFENRLIKVTKADGSVVEHQYDPEGNRVQTKVTPANGPPATTNFLVDTSGSLSQVVAETDETGALKAYYLRGDDLLAVLRPSAPGSYVTRFFHADGLGSIRRLTNEAGTITDGYTYSAFGELLAHTGSDPQPYAFTGEPLDPNSMFQYHRARWMDPRTGRFGTIDAFAGETSDPTTLHKYLYGAADPLNRFDPTGAMPMPMELEIGRNAHRLISLFYRYLGALIDSGERAVGGFGKSRWRTDIAFIRDAGIAGGRVLFPGTRGEVYEIKSLRQAALGFASADLRYYIGELRRSVPATDWRPGVSVIPMPPSWPGALVHPTLKDTVMQVTLRAPGEIAYEFAPLPYDPEEPMMANIVQGIVMAGVAVIAVSVLLSSTISLKAASGF
jgi:RHS repeat-associated protein